MFGNCLQVAVSVAFTTDVDLYPIFYVLSILSVLYRNTKLMWFTAATSLLLIVLLLQVQHGSVLVKPGYSLLAFHGTMVTFFAGIAAYFISMLRRQDMALIETNDRYQRELHHMAYHDALTNLPNRAYVNTKLQEAAAANRQIGVLFLDLDNFKQINDHLGHSAGDELLIQAGHRLGSVVRTQDLVARLGGDEFVILIENVESHDQAQNLVSRISDVMNDPFEVRGLAVRVTFSVGISLQETGEGVEELMSRADQAMYEAKRRGQARAHLSRRPSRKHVPSVQ